MAVNESGPTISVEGAGVSLGMTFPDQARERVRAVAEKYLGTLTSASVHVSKEGITYRCTVVMHMGGLRPKSAEGAGNDVYAAFQAALDKIAKQLRRMKRAVRDDKAERPDKDAMLRA